MQTEKKSYTVRSQARMRTHVYKEAEVEAEAAETDETLEKSVVSLGWS
jgi:hypothetical protein